MIQPTWQEPKQARSRERFERILSVAAQTFADDGFETTTTNAIASAADVPIGTLYQFFPNKDAILDALIHRYIQAMQAHATVDLATSPSFIATVKTLISNLMAFDRTYTGFAQMLGTLEHKDSVQQIHQAMIQNVMGILAYYFPALNDAQRYRCALMGFHVVKGTMTLVVIPEGERVQEITTVLTAYVRAFIAREGVEVRG